MVLLKLNLGRCVSFEKAALFRWIKAGAKVGR
jgi:hypothetical protein